MIEDGEPELLFLSSLALGDLAAVKHGDFQHEREWRLAALSEPDPRPSSESGMERTCRIWT